MTRVLGVILAGGLARRMGGGDKPLKTVGGISILARVIARLRPQADALVLNANGDPSRFAAFGLDVVPDAVPDHPGPLAGILAALDRAAAHGFAEVVSVTGDAPFLPADLVARLRGARDREEVPLACAASGGFAHPPIGLWPVDLREPLRRALVDEGLRKIDAWTARFGCASAEWPTDPFDPFFNANTPDDLAAAEAIAARHATA